MRIGVPSYFSPACSPEDWACLEALPAGSIAIVNPDSGPAPGMSAEYGDAVRAVRRHGVLVYGYIDLAYGASGLASVARAAAAYRRRLGVDGAFLDQAPADAAALAPYHRLGRGLRAMGLRTAINPGRPLVDGRAGGWFDEVVTFEGHWSDYRRLPVRFDATADAGRWHLVYGVPETETFEAVARARRHGAGVAYVTDGHMPNPWLGLPAAWRSLVGLSRAPGRAATVPGWRAPALIGEP